MITFLLGAATGTAICLLNFAILLNMWRRDKGNEEQNYRDINNNELKSSEQ